MTLRDIAQRLGVSHATVSRALNAVEDPFISEATRERVRNAAREMGYRPNHAARSLLSGRTGLLALWLYPLRGQTSYHAAVSRTMSVAASARRYQMIVDPIDPRGEADGETRGFDRWHVDGIVAHEASPTLESQIVAGIRPPVPIVTTGAYLLLEGVDRVEVDLLEGARDAMRHLVESGRRRIVYVTDDLDAREGDARHIAFVETMHDAGLEPRFLDIASTRRGARESIRAHFEGLDAPDALFCHNDDFALGVYRGLCDLGVRVPDDVALVGCDGIEDLEYLEVPITTVAQPLDAMCTLALEMLERRIQEPEIPLQRETLRAKLVVRASSGG